MRHSRFSFGTNSASRNSTPIAMIATPATFSSVERESASVSPTPVAVMPSSTKIAVKVRMNRLARTSTPRIAVSGERSSSGESPQTVDR